MAINTTAIKKGARLTGVVGEPLAELGEFHDVISIAIYRV